MQGRGAHDSRQRDGRVKCGDNVRCLGERRDLSDGERWRRAPLRNGSCVKTAFICVTNNDARYNSQVSSNPGNIQISQLRVRTVVDASTIAKPESMELFKVCISTSIDSAVESDVGGGDGTGVDGAVKGLGFTGISETVGAGSPPSSMSLAHLKPCPTGFVVSWNSLQASHSRPLQDSWWHTPAGRLLGLALGFEHRAQMKEASMI